MSNSQFSLTIKAREVIDQVPKRLRSKFVSDAVVHYMKKKGVMDDYLVHGTISSPVAEKPTANAKATTERKPEPIDSVPTLLDNKDDEIIKPETTGKIKVDDGY